MRASKYVFALLAAGCAGASPDERAAETDRIVQLSKPAVPTDDQRRLVETDSTPDGLATKAGREGRLAAELKGPQAARLAFRIGAEDLVADSAAFLGANLPADAAPETVAAAAMGLAVSKSDATERVLVGLALRASHPPEAVEALFAYYYHRGAAKPAPSKLPDAKLLDFERHPTARGRAALAHLGRVVKDPALVPVLERLATDEDFEVRRAAALAMTEGPPKSHRPEEDRARCIAALDARVSGLFNDDPHVVVSGCRALATYDDAEIGPLLAVKLHHVDFNVRVAALEGLGKRKSKSAITMMIDLAKTDPSTSVRYTAAEQLAEIDAAIAMQLVDGLLADPSEYVRTAGVDLLATSDDAAAIARLAAIAKSDPHVRVRETAVGAFEGKKDSKAAKDAVRAALADPDAGIVSNACGVVAKNKWADLFDDVTNVPARFPGCLGAAARAAALSSLSEFSDSLDSDLGVTKLDRRIFESYVHDVNPAVRAAAENALAKLDKKDPPKQPTRGADLSGELLPGGAPVFERDVFLVVETFQGTMKIRLFPEQAPVHCAHVVALARSGFYDGLTWHRVVPDFVVQGGCPRGDGAGNAGVTLPLEPTTIPFERGTLGMARGEHPDSGGCQLFICHSRAPHLDVRYTAFGKVVEGLDVIDKIDVDGKIDRVTVEGAR